MDWVEVAFKDVDGAVAVAMTELDVSSREEVEVTVLQEPKPGFLGVGGKEAIVRVTKTGKKRRRRSRGRGKGGQNANQNKQQKQQRSNGGQKNSQKGKGSGKQGQGSGQSKNRSGKQQQEKKVTESQETAAPAADERPEQAPIEEQAKVAADFVSGLLDAFGLEGSVGTRVEEEILYIDVTGEQTEALIGPKGSVMQSVLELTRTVVQRKTFGAPRMRIDINGYTERRREALRIYTGKLAEGVIADQDEVMLEPMNAAERKVVHDAVAEIDGVRSYSEGEEPRRAVVIAYDGD